MVRADERARGGMRGAGMRVAGCAGRRGWRGCLGGQSEEAAGELKIDEALGG